MKCSHCEQDKALNLFTVRLRTLNKRGTISTYYFPECRECRAAIAQQQRAAKTWAGKKTVPRGYKPKPPRKVRP